MSIDYYRELAEELERAVKYYRDRCPVLASDVGSEHTDARVWMFALTNGWVKSPDPSSQWATPQRMVERGTLRHIVDQDSASGTASFCNKHAQASGMAPLDVLEAIGAVP